MLASGLRLSKLSLLATKKSVLVPRDAPVATAAMATPLDNAIEVAYRTRKLPLFVTS